MIFFGALQQLRLLLLFRGRLFRSGEVVFHEYVKLFVFDFVHVGKFVVNPAELLVRVDGDVTVLAENLQFQEAAVPAVRKSKVFEQAGMFFADGEFVRE